MIPGFYDDLVDRLSALKKDPIVRQVAAKNDHPQLRDLFAEVFTESDQEDLRRRRITRFGGFFGVSQYC